MAKECSNSSCNKSSCEGCGQKQPQSLMAEPNVFSDVKHVIGVVSGKGGVGKSFVTGSLANLMASKGYKVGIMDADITGPSIPKMYGIKGNAQGSDNGIYPMPTANGIEVMSVNLLLPDEETPVIWRGPVLANMVRMIVKKAYNMADMMKVPVLGIVENYSYVKCPDCGKEIKVFGESHIDEIAAELKVPVLGKMPIDVKLAELADSGLFSKIENEYITAAADVMPKDEA